MTFNLTLIFVLLKRFVFVFLLFLPFISCKDAGEKPKAKQKLNASVKSTDERAKKQIESDIRYYIESLNEKRFDELITLTSTKLFVNKSVEDYKIDLIKQNISGVYKQIDLKKIESLSEIVEYKNEYYCKINCTGNVVLNVSGEALSNIEALKYQFEYSYDTPNAIIDDGKVVINDAYFSFIAHCKKGSNFLWKYIEVDKQKEPYYDKIIPVEVLDKL